MSTTTNLSSLVINYLTQAQYDSAAQAGTLNENQLYLTPSTILASVATSGDYNDLNNKPTIPTIPANNIAGSGTSGSLVKFSGTNSITNGPALGSSITTFLRNDGSWAIPPGTITTATTSGSGNAVTAITASNGALTITKGTTFQTNIGKLTLSLTTSGWSNNSQTITVTGVTTSNHIIVSPAPASIDNYTTAKIKCTTQAANSLTFTCETTPTAAISVNVLIIN